MYSIIFIDDDSLEHGDRTEIAILESRAGAEQKCRNLAAIRMIPGNLQYWIARIISSVRVGALGEEPLNSEAAVYSGGLNFVSG
jgi:hypothetical protein